MSWHFSRELVAAYSEAKSLDGVRHVQSSSTATGGRCFLPARTIERSIRFRSGTTSAPLTDFHGEDALAWYLAGFPASAIPRRLEAGTMRMISGRKCGESWQRQLPGTYSPKTFREKLLTKRRTTLKRWVTKPAALPFPRRTWVVTTFGPDIGYVHTPTTKANYTSTSMQKWPSCRNFVKAFGHISPEVQEWLMAWPTDWTAMKPLATAKFRLWLQRHGACSASS
jgi:hypothetical protein